MLIDKGVVVRTTSGPFPGICGVIQDHSSEGIEIAYTDPRGRIQKVWVPWGTIEPWKKPEEKGTQRDIIKKPPAVVVVAALVFVVFAAAFGGIYLGGSLTDWIGWWWLFLPITIPLFFLFMCIGMGLVAVITIICEKVFGKERPKNNLARQ